jgi:tetratricopeptide (TPR) repeat protein
MMKIFLAGLLLLSTIGYSQKPEDLIIDAFGNYQEGAYKEAIEAFNSILAEKTKDDQKIKLFKGMAEYKLSNYFAAIEDLKLLAQNGNIPEACIWLARSYAAMGDKQNTIFYIQRYLQLANDPFYEKINKDSVFHFLYTTNEWLDLWQKNWLSDAQKAQNDAEYYIGKKDFGQAHQIIENEILKNASNTQLIAFNGEIYEKEGNTELALNEVNKAITLEPENSKILKQRATYLSSLGKFSDAVSDLSNILKTSPEDFDARYLRAGAALNAKQIELAKSDIQLYLKYFTAENSFYLAGQIYYAAGEYLNALKFFNRIMDKKYPDVRYFRARGMTYYQTNSYDLAAYDLSMSLDLEPGNQEANLYLGLAEYYRGNAKSACYYWKRAKELGELKSISYLQKYCND